MQPTEEQTYREGIEHRLDSQDGKLDEILAQTKKTNGRVNQLEIDKAVTQGQMRLIKGLLYAVCSVLAFLIVQVVVPIASALIQSGAVQ